MIWVAYQRSFDPQNIADNGVKYGAVISHSEYDHTIICTLNIPNLYHWENGVLDRIIASNLMLLPLRNLHRAFSESVPAEMWV